MAISIVTSLPENTWRTYIDGHPQANIFHTPEMFSVFSKSSGHVPSIWAAIDDTNEPSAILTPVEITLRDGIFHPWTTRAVAYGSVLCSPGKIGQDGLLQLLKAYSYSVHGRMLFSELRNLSSMSSFQSILNECNFVYQDHLNYHVDLSQPENILWRRLSKSCRQRIRIAESKGTIIEEAINQGQLLIAYQLLQGVYSRVKVPLAPLSLFKSAFEICRPLEMFKVFLARVGDQYIGSAFILMYKGRITAWYSASDKKYYAYNPGELLKWHIFQWGKAKGYRLFDFGGAGRPDEAYGPRNFKAKFGGDLVNFGRNICVHAKARYDISKKVYSIARKVLAFSA